jgi:hypothetical protein
VIFGSHVDEKAIAIPNLVLELLPGVPQSSQRFIKKNELIWEAQTVDRAMSIG